MSWNTRWIFTKFGLKNHYILLFQVCSKNFSWPFLGATRAKNRPLKQLFLMNCLMNLHQIWHEAWLHWFPSCLFKEYCSGERFRAIMALLFWSNISEIFTLCIILHADFNFDLGRSDDIFPCFWKYIIEMLIMCVFQLWPIPIMNRWPF